MASSANYEVAAPLKMEGFEQQIRFSVEQSDQLWASKFIVTNRTNKALTPDSFIETPFVQIDDDGVVFDIRENIGTGSDKISVKVQDKRLSLTDFLILPGKSATFLILHDGCASNAIHGTPREGKIIHYHPRPPSVRIRITLGTPLVLMLLLPSVAMLLSDSGEPLNPVASTAGFAAILALCFLILTRGDSIFGRIFGLNETEISWWYLSAPERRL